MKKFDITIEDYTVDSKGSSKKFELVGLVNNNKIRVTYNSTGDYFSVDAFNAKRNYMDSVGICSCKEFKFKFNKKFHELEQHTDKNYCMWNCHSVKITDQVKFNKIAESILKHAFVAFKSRIIRLNNNAG